MKNFLGSVPMLILTKMTWRQRCWPLIAHMKVELNILWGEDGKTEMKFVRALGDWIIEKTSLVFMVITVEDYIIILIA